MSTTTVKILFASTDWHVESSAELEEPLDELLIAAGVGEITSGGVGPDGVFFNVEIEDPATGLAAVQQALRDLRVPRSTVIQGSGGIFPVYEES